MDKPFLFIGGHLCLDFLNTKKGGPTGALVELLETPERLNAWFVEAGLAPIEADDALLEEARSLRTAILATVRAAIAGERPVPAEALALINRVLTTGAKRHRLTETLDDREESVDTPHPLLPLAEAALDLLTRHDRTLVRQCSGTGCILWFLDNTKNKRRRWCRMEACGNRAKVAAHYHRHHPEEIQA